MNKEKKENIQNIIEEIIDLLSQLKTALLDE